MSDFNRDTKNKAIVEGWPDPDDYDKYEVDEDDWDNDVDDEGPMDYEVQFKVKGATREEVRVISRYLFEAISKELDIPYYKLEDIKIEED